MWLEWHKKAPQYSVWQGGPLHWFERHLIMCFASIRIFAVILLSVTVCTPSNAYADEALPIPQVSQKEPVFPLKVVFYGYVQRFGSVTAILQIEGQTMILRQGVDKVVSFEGAPKATRLRFDEIDFENREIRLGFESGYLPKVCRMQSQ